MSITIKDLNEKDYDIARQFAIEGMNLNRYCKYAHELYFYSRYYFYMELLKATQVLAAYEDDKLLGILLAQMKNESKKVNSFWLKTFVNSMNFVTNTFYKGESLYNNTNKEMLDEYMKNNEPDGEILFFGVDKNARGKGIGTLLLKELEKIEKGKKIYLYTDSDCTYQFYEKRGFSREQERNIDFLIHGKPLPLTCFLFSKVL
jgi:ribosomal protein S18 acetylase RimI-like enzyme